MKKQYNKPNNVYKCSDSSSENFFLSNEVEESGIRPIEKVFETLCNERGISFAEFYNSIGIDKSYASKIKRGLIIPPKYLRVKISQFFKVDSTIIWDYPVIIPANKLEEKEDANIN